MFQHSERVIPIPRRRAGHKLPSLPCSLFSSQPSLHWTRRQKKVHPHSPLRLVSILDRLGLLRVPRFRLGSLVGSSLGHVVFPARINRLRSVVKGIG